MGKVEVVVLHLVTHRCKKLFFTKKKKSFGRRCGTFCIDMSLEGTSVAFTARWDVKKCRMSTKECEKTKELRAKGDYSYYFMYDIKIINLSCGRDQHLKREKKH